MPVRTGVSWWCRRAGGARREEGFTLIELLVAMTLFLVLGAITLSAIVTLSQGLERERITSDITAEARVALERIAREARQAHDLDNPSVHSMTLRVDFDGSGTDNGTLADPEVVTYAFDSGSDSIEMTAQDQHGATITEALLAGQVEELAFTYTSSDWTKDADNDGTVTQAEAGPDGVDRVQISLTVERDDHDEVFRTQVTLRNRSQS
jgi:prepilin-type N-terminal cleavage/methylation domain-containing protein